jgi:hypothetical protein
MFGEQKCVFSRLEFSHYNDFTYYKPTITMIRILDDRLTKTKITQGGDILGYIYFSNSGD